MKRVALYVRVSTEEQKKHGLSVDSQIKALTDWALENDYKIVGIYNDAGLSASVSYKKRKALLDMIADCQKGKIDLIIFTKLDRFFRSVPDYYACIEQMNDIPWKTIWEDYETETSAGKFKVNIMLAIAQAESERTGERIKATMDYKKERGDYIGSAPTGYIVKGRDLLKDPETSEGMQAFFDKYLITFSISKAIEEAAEHGLNLNRSHMSKLIKNPAYYGETAQGYKCEPYITKEDHNKIISTISKNARETKYPKRTFMFSGLCVCGYCGHRMPSKAVMRTHANGEKVTHKKYLCQYHGDMRFRCPSLQISEKPLEAYLLDQLDELLEGYRVKVKSINQKVDGKGFKKKKELEAKLKRLANLYADGDLTIEEYRTKRDKVKEELANIVTVPLQEPPELPEEWREIYDQLDEEHRRMFWVKLIKCIRVTNENKANPEVVFCDTL